MDFTASRVVGYRSARGWGAPALLVWTLLWSLVWLSVHDTQAAPSFRLVFSLLAFASTGYGVIAAKLMSRSDGLAVALRSLRLGPWFGIGFAVVFGPTSLIWLKDPRPTGITDDWALLDAYKIVLFGFAAFVVAHLSARPSWRLRYLPRRVLPVGGPSVRAVVTLWLLSMLSQAYSASAGSLGYLSADPTAAASTSLPQALALARSLGFLATLLAGWRVASDRTDGARFLALTVLVSQVGLSLFAGLKEPALTQVVALFAGYAVIRPVRVRWVVGVLAGFVLIVVPFVTIYRQEVTVGAGRLTPTQAIAQISFGSLAGDTVSTSDAASWDQLAVRLSRIGDVAIIVQKTPSMIPEGSPRELAEAPLLGVIPRTLWPGKPALVAGQVMAQQYYNSTKTTSAAVTPEGDLWRHGGGIPLVIGMGLFGFLVALVDNRRGNASRDPRLLFLPMLLFSSIVKEESDYVGLLAGLATTAIVSALAVWLVGVLSQSDELTT